MTDTAQRYQPGGDIYAKLQSQYGTAGANKVARAAANGESINLALTEVKWGPPLNDSTTGIFVDQITSDPLAAPLDSANAQIGNAVTGIFKNPWVLALLVGVLFWQLGGFEWARKKLA